MLLLAIPNVELTACVKTVPSLLSQESLCAADKEGAPTLVILYAASRDDSASVQIREIKQAYPGTRCLALVDAGRQRPPALEAGADKVLLKGVPAAQLSAAIRQVLIVDTPAPGDIPEA